MSTDIHITEKEFLAIEDTDFLLTKAAVIPKIKMLLEETRKELTQCVNASKYSFPNGIDLTTGKISRGENYLNLPFMVLDYPAYFKLGDIFAYRTMFWWGNFFSTTLHLGGVSLEKTRESISRNILKLIGEDIYICVGETPWQYHYEENNYIPVSEIHGKYIDECRFLKLSKKIELKDWRNLPSFSSDFFNLLLKII